MVDVEDLIACVFERPSVWDKREKTHSNRNVVDKCWVEISKKMGSDEIVLRKKWKNLRDQFAVELGKIPPTRPGSDFTDITHASKWQYFSLLLFLKDIIKPRNSSTVQSTDTGSLRDDSDRVDDMELLTLDNEDCYGTSPSSTQDIPLLIEEEGLNDNSKRNSSSTPKSSSGAGAKRTKTNDYSENILKIERQKLAYLFPKSRNRENNDDLLFFKSLLPHVKKIPDFKKLLFRNRIQEVVQEFAYPLQNDNIA